MKKGQKIRVVEYVRVGEEVVEISRLTEQQRRKVDAWILQEYLSGLFLGEAEFFAPEKITGKPVPADAVCV